MVRFICCFVLSLIWSPSAVAQGSWPARPVIFIVASSPGGATDTFARVIAQRLTDTLKQPFIIENKAGANGNLGAGAVAKAEPNGYTFLIAGTQSLIINPSLFKNLGYNADRDLMPVARGVISPMVLVSHPSLSAKTVGDLVELGKRDPEGIPFGSAGYGSTTYLGVLALEEAAGARFLHVPFKGLGQAFQTLVSGDVKFIYSDVGTALPMIRSGAIRALALTQPASQLPETPTVADAGYPGTEVIGTFSVAAPAGTSPEIVKRLSTAINEAMRYPAVAQLLERHALIPVFDTPETFGVALKAERDRWSKFIRLHNIAVE